MGKAARRKREPQSAQSGKVHERIQTEAKKRCESPEFILSEFLMDDPAPGSALGGLFEAARVAAGNATPIRFVYEGRPYWLRVSIGAALLELFDSPATSKPLARALAGSTDKFGHMPGH